ncbi:MAG: hypothetical protein OXK72_06780 [Gammaproteobacteria bacterium]|nr:hypothetical protein [Gammaproteobacteria bacterium]
MAISSSQDREFPVQCAGLGATAFSLVFLIKFPPQGSCLKVYEANSLGRTPWFAGVHGSGNEPGDVLPA